MLIACTNKGCIKTSNALLNEETGEIICGECGKSIDGISESMKRTLKSFGQIVRNNERKAFVMGCRKCRANREVVLNENDDTVCKICHEPIAMTATFKLAMEESGTKLEKIDTNKKTKGKISRKKTK